MSSVDQLQIITTALSGYFGSVSLNLDNTANALPSFEDSIGSIVHDQILTDAVQGADRAASFSTGALVDTVHLSVAVEREFNMRQKTKAEYFDDGSIDLANTADYTAFLFGKYLNYYRGTSPEQSKGE